MNNKIEINNISYEYPRGRKVFINFSLELNKGETTVITGKKVKKQPWLEVNWEYKTFIPKTIRSKHKRYVPWSHR